MKCKLKVIKLTIEEGDVKQPDGNFERGNVAHMEATAVADDSEENKQFFGATPSGALNLYVCNEAAVAGLKEGDEIYVTIEKAPAAQAAEATTATAE